VTSNDAQLVEVLIQAGAKINAKTIYGVSAMMIAHEMGREECELMLKKYGANSAEEDQLFLKKFAKQKALQDPELFEDATGLNAKELAERFPEVLTIEERKQLTHEERLQKMLKFRTKEGIKYVKREDKLKKEEAYLEWRRNRNETAWKEELDKMHPAARYHEMAQEEFYNEVLPSSQAMRRERDKARAHRRATGTIRKGHMEDDSVLDELTVDLSSDVREEAAINMTSLMLEARNEAYEDFLEYKRAKETGILPRKELIDALKPKNYTITVNEEVETDGGRVVDTSKGSTFDDDYSDVYPDRS